MPQHEYEHFDDHRIKHLEMLQAVISRLGGNGFVIKGWAVTVAGVFVGLAVNADDCAFARVGTGTALVFWGLDAYFLRAERRFRKLFDHVRSFNPGVDPFFMGATSPKWVESLSTEERQGLSWLGSATSWTLLLFYGAIIGATLAASFLI